MWKVRFHPVATEELARLSQRGRAAVANAVEKLKVFGPRSRFLTPVPSRAPSTCVSCGHGRAVAAAITRLAEVEEDGP